MISGVFGRLRLVGGFRELPHGQPDGPSLRDAVRPQAAPDEDALLKYLGAGSVLKATATVVHDVLGREPEVIGGLSLLTDGDWLWYSDLAHYVERHHVALDACFVEQARCRDWQPPQLTWAGLASIEAVVLGADGV
jgi:hypothetical protein